MGAWRYGEFRLLLVYKKLSRMTGTFYPSQFMQPEFSSQDQPPQQAGLPSAPNQSQQPQGLGAPGTYTGAQATFPGMFPQQAGMQSTSAAFPPNQQQTPTTQTGTALPMASGLPMLCTLALNRSLGCSLSKLECNLPVLPLCPTNSRRPLLKLVQRCPWRPGLPMLCTLAFHRSPPGQPPAFPLRDSKPRHPVNHRDSDRQQHCSQDNHQCPECRHGR
jgi:hypothetical protein